MLIHAGAGGVGNLLVQMAKLRQAVVITTVSTKEKAEIARAAGADFTILYTETDFHEEVMKFTLGKGVHCVFGKKKNREKKNPTKQKQHCFLRFLFFGCLVFFFIFLDSVGATTFEKGIKCLRGFFLFVVVAQPPIKCTPRPPPFSQRERESDKNNLLFAMRERERESDHFFFFDNFFILGKNK